MEGRNNRVLIVDDEPEIHEDFREMLSLTGLPSATDELAAAFLEQDVVVFPPTFELLHAHGGDQACAMVQEAKASGDPIALAFVDIRMPPGMDGVTTLRRIRETDSDIEFVIMTAYTDKSLPDIVEGLVPLHKLLYIRKPFAREEIQQITVALVEKYNVEQRLEVRERDLRSSHGRLEAIIGATGEAIAMFDLQDRLAFANRRFEELCGVGEGALVGRPLRDCEPQWGALRSSDMEYAALFGGEDALRRFVGDGSSSLFHQHRTVVTDADGREIGWLHLYRDLSAHVDNRRMDAEMRQLRLEIEAAYSFSGIVGASSAMRQVFGLMKRAARGDMPVLVQGESGTGKELVAKALHFNGPRKAKRLEIVNCAALPDALVESELFGHERGAFTGAVGRRLGAFERADGGTIFLDEIADMKPDLQAKLLRVLQEREIQRLGGSDRIPIDAQIIAATNQELEQAMRDGAFREDLYFRIAAFPITIPPLRERRDDIPLLAAHFLKQATERTGVSVGGFAPEAIQRMLGADWPGNVRELENVIGRAVLLAQSDTLRTEDLWPAEHATAPHAVNAAGVVLPLAEVERRVVAHALEVFNHNVTRAAHALGINRTTLHRKVKTLGARRVR